MASSPRTIKHPCAKVATRHLDFFYGRTKALDAIDLEIPVCRVTALIGPSGCGKSTFLRCLNRMNDLIRHTRVAGKVLLDEQDIYEPDLDVVALRKRVGMVFQKPNPLPNSIFENVAFGLRINGVRNRAGLAATVEHSLHGAGLWEEVKDRLQSPALGLSGGQQQRLCIARALAVAPEVILMDEPASALDPLATAKLEELIITLKKQFTIIIVTHSMQQAARISDYTAFFYMGKLVEVNTTDRIFGRPAMKKTEEYITGRFG